MSDAIRSKILELESLDKPAVEVSDCDLPIEVIVEVAEPVTDDGFRIFNDPVFGDVRTIEEDGKVLFCGFDVAKALQYNEPHKAISRHCPHGMKRPVGVQTGKKNDGTTAIQTVEMSFIPEGDVYRLIVRSKLPEAERFEHWLFDEVVPKIRKHGMYAVHFILILLRSPNLFTKSIFSTSSARSLTNKFM